ncbi:hypothetical protein LCGC14_1129880 [marine sediment metagenome]|uniref:Uncharacterized protein n=1 Tax=marine sediment metagenome TaxID=412755 RepID=A0A0F9M685_9ZZZZ
MQTKAKRDEIRTLYEKHKTHFPKMAQTVVSLCDTCNELEDQVAILMAKAVDFELKIIARIEGLEAAIERLKAEATR